MPDDSRDDRDNGPTVSGRSGRTEGSEGRNVVRAWVSELQRRIERARPGSSAIDVAVRTVRHDLDIGGSILADAIAFRLFVFFVPYVFVLVYGLGLMADASGSSPQSVARDVGITGLFAGTIETVADQSAGTRVVVLVIAGFAVYSTSSSLVKTLIAAHVLIWAVPRRKSRKRAALGGAFVLVLSSELALGQATASLREHAPVIGAVATVAFVAVPGATWLLLSYKLLPGPAPARWLDFWPGAVLFGVGLEALHLFTVVWISRQVEGHSQTYGAIGASLALLLWAYVAGRIVVLAAELNSQNWYRRHGPSPPDP